MDRSRDFFKFVNKSNGQLTAESRASLKERQMHSRNFRNQTYEHDKYLDYPRTQNDALNRQYEEYYNHHPQQQAGRGGGDYKDVAISSNKNYCYDESIQHKKSQTDFKHRKSDETFSHESSCFSDHSDSTRITALKKQIPNGKKLMDLVGSKASLHKTIEDGITSMNKKNPCSIVTTAENALKNQSKTPNTKLSCSESVDDQPCPTCQSAELINDKNIHPMVKKFRLLLLHNIKEEVGIMEDLEKLPNKLVKFCKEMEKDLCKPL